jgi:hypothetical protein
MIAKDINNNTLSSTFNSKTTSAAQRLKPKVVIDWMDSRHLTTLTASTDDPHANTTQGEIGYFFAPKQAVNGIERQSYTWGVAGAKDVNGKVIKADGNWYAMPSDNSDNYEFGWWSGSTSTATPHSTYSGYGFSSNPTVSFEFDSRKCNIIRVVTSEYYGQIDTYRITVRSNDAGAPDPVYSEVGTISDGYYYRDHRIVSDDSTQTIYRVELEIISTKNPEDYARVQELNILLKNDISDYVIDYSATKTRDLHETSLPIAGTSSGTLNVNLDNTEKKFNLIGNAGTYGPLMKKDLKVYATTGWQIQKYSGQYVDKELSANISASDTTITVSNVDDLPDGGVGNYFVMVINPDSIYEEKILCSSTTGTYTLNVSQRGFDNTTARAHSVGTTVRFDTFEYPAYMEAYVDEWGSSSDSMAVSMSAMDWSKFMSEKIVSKGFFLTKTTVPDACENLLMISNFPKGNIDNLNRFDITAGKKDAVLHFDFNEETRDRANNTITVSDGFRSRFFAMPSNALNQVKDIKADALDRKLTQLEKALGEKSFISPDFVDNSSDISSNTTLAIDLQNFTFTNNAGETVDTYYNGVFDGFYIPIESGDQVISIDIAHGGVRVFLEENLIMNEWRNHVTNPATPETVQSELVNLTAGKPYKIRIEMFHTKSYVTGEDFTMLLQYQLDGGSLADLYASDFKTVAVLDKIGSRDASFNKLTSGNPTPDRNKQSNYALYLGGGDIGLSGGMTSISENFSALLGGTKYIRLPYHSSWNVMNSSSNNYTGEWSFELYIKPTEVFSGDGEYLSNWANAAPTSGFEFYSNSSSNGFKLITSSGTESVSSATALSTTDWSHLIVTYDGTTLSYYVNGELEDSTTLSGAIEDWSSLDATFGGRGASFTELSGENTPSTIRDIYFDQFLMYRKSLTSTEVSNRYTETQMKELTIYPFLYGNETSIREIIDQITLADLGRFYIDEENNARYEHYYRFFETSIDQHANTQLSINDSNAIISAEYNVQLQANRVVVKIAGLSSNLVGVQPLWRADDPTTLAVVNLEESITASDTSIYVSTTTDPPFSKAGYLVIDNEIIRYTSTTPNSFTNLERGKFGTTAASHTANSPVREARYWDLTYDKAPAFSVKNPFITGIAFEEPDQIDILKWVPGNYGAELVIAANANVDKNTIVFAEGTNPLTEKVAFTAIAGIPVLLSDQSSQIKEQVAELSDNIRLYGLKEVVIENIFITEFDHGQKIADFVIDKMSTPIPILNVVSIPTPRLKVGDRLRITNMDAFDIINGDYWVVSKEYTYSDSPSQNMMLRRVV